MALNFVLHFIGITECYKNSSEIAQPESSDIELKENRPLLSCIKPPSNMHYERQITQHMILDSVVQ